MLSFNLPCGRPTGNAPKVLPVHFRYALGFPVQRLAYMLDSLVRVSRRVVQSRFTNDIDITVEIPTSHFSITITDCSVITTSCMRTLTPFPTPRREPYAFTGVQNVRSEPVYNTCARKQTGHLPSPPFLHPEPTLIRDAGEYR